MSIRDEPVVRSRGPTPPAERIVLVDVLRGFAVLGILVVNMLAFKSAAAYTPTAPGAWTGAVDRLVSSLILLLAIGKLYLLFTFLFGVGFHLQVERAEARGVPFAGRFVRRMAVLPLAAVGRMALTNYLLQSLVCTSLFYGYGFGLYGKVGPAAGLVISLAVFALQVVLSSAWLWRFRFGPLEWLWRTAGYAAPA